MYKKPSLAKYFLLLNFLIGCLTTSAEDGEPVRGSYQAMDYGSVIAETISAPWPEDNLTLKGLSIRLDHDASMVFDTGLMRWSSGNLGGWIDLSRASHMSFKGSHPPEVEGESIFGTAPAPGWAWDGSFEDVREHEGTNPPREWMLWHGLYHYGDRVVLAYRIGETEILESPAAIEVGGKVVLTRSLQTAGSGQELEHYVAQLQPDAQVEEVANFLRIEQDGGILALRVESEVEGVRFQVREERVELFVPAHRESARTVLFIWNESEKQSLSPDALRKAFEEVDFDFETALLGGPTRWEEELETGFEFGEEEAAYVLDKVELPFENPWGSWFRPSAFAFFEDGDRAAISTWNGDVWIVSGLLSDEGKVSWKRFATGLYYPMGMAIVDGIIHVTERSQLTRLHDLNGDGEADFYESINNDGVLYPMAHSLCLEIDSEGNFYFFKNGNRVPDTVPEHGALIRVSADGRERTVIASGIRGANGLGIGPDGLMLGTDQEGNWVPTTRVDALREGGYYGFPRHNPMGRIEGDYDLPVTWIPHGVDSSSGAVTYVGDERAGPIFGNWVVASYGRAVLL
ncbi:MAG TPA: DUF6797 domain-containing protein, partial [Opitutales bacterium]|nr:DUF6797 domain-containing protein [Opitutales bacterium]